MRTKQKNNLACPKRCHNGEAGDSTEDLVVHVRVKVGYENKKTPQHALKVSVFRALKLDTVRKKTKAMVGNGGTRERRAWKTAEGNSAWSPEATAKCSLKRRLLSDTCLWVGAEFLKDPAPDRPFVDVVIEATNGGV